VNPNFVIQHEFDFESTYIVDTRREDDETGGIVCEFPPVFNAKLRIGLATMLVDALNNHPGNPYV